MLPLTKKLTSSFSGIYLDEGTKLEPLHNYYRKNKELISASKFISSLYEKFDKKTILPKTAKKLGIDKDVLDGYWTEAKDIGIEKGNDGHDYGENTLIKKYKDTIVSKGKVDISKLDSKANVDYTKISIDNPVDIPRDTYYKASIDLFWEELDEDRYEVIAIELRMFSLVYGLAGTTDILLFDKLTNKIIIADYKTNKNLYRKYGNMFFPFDDFENNKLSHYTIQLNIYQMMLEEAGFEVSERWVIWTKRNNQSLYTLIKVEDVQPLIHIACANYRNNRQGSENIQSRYSL